MLIDGIRKCDAEKIKSAWKSFGDLSVKGVRTEKWIRENLDNPFRDWDRDYDQKIGKKAASIYKKALKAIDKLPDQKLETTESVLRSYVEAFNRFAEELDTTAREVIVDAYHLLASSDKLNRKESKRCDSLLEDWREF